MKPDTHLTPADRQLVQRLRRHYTPPEMSPGRRAAFDRSLDDRLRDRRRRVRTRAAAAVTAALATGVGAAALALYGVPGSGSPPQPPWIESGSATEFHALTILTLEETADFETRRFLPDDYLVLAELIGLEPSVGLQTGRDSR